MMACSNCDKGACFRCSRCNITSYCSRECQVAHWQLHKADCSMNQVIFAAHKKIRGNILSVAAYYENIIVTINETRSDFCQLDSFHFATITGHRPSFTHTISTVMYVLDDVKVSMSEPITELVKKTKNKYAQVAQQTISFDL